MQQEDIDKIIRCRGALDFFKGIYAQAEESYEQIEVYMLDELRKDGFNSIKNFLKFNEDMCLEALKEYRPIHGECDFCGEATPLSQRCIVLYGNSACANKIDKRIDDRFYLGILFVIRKSTYRVKDANDAIDGKIYSLCKEGHGYYTLASEIKPFPFPLDWKYDQSIPSNSNWTKADHISVGKVKEDVK